MKPLRLGIALALAATAGLAAAPAARADHNDRYYGYRYYRGRDRHEIERRAILRERLIALGDAVRFGERDGCLTRREADRLYDRLDRVRDFLRDDRYLTDSEFRRRMRDLDDVEEDLYDECGPLGPRFGYGHGCRYHSRYRSDCAYCRRGR